MKFLVCFAIALWGIYAFRPVEKERPSADGSWVINWTKDGAQGYLLGRDFQFIVERHPHGFDKYPDSKFAGGHDTIGYFINKNGYLWIVADPFDRVAISVLHAKQLSDGRFKVISCQTGAPELGECGFPWKDRIQGIGPLIVLLDPTSGSGYCAGYPNFYLVDGKRVQHAMNELVFWVCDESTTPVPCYDRKHTFEFRDSLLFEHCVETEMDEETRTFVKQRKYTVRYTLRDDHLILRDTLK